MIIDSRRIEGKNLTWLLRCPAKEDAAELSELRIQIDGETENLDREAGEDFMSKEDFEAQIEKDTRAERNLFIVADVDGKLVGFARCEGNLLSRFRHKAEFGICILKEYWGNSIGRVLLETIVSWADDAGIEKISLNVVENNEKAIRMYKRYGFIEEGLLRKDRLHRNGEYYNTVVMGRFAN